MRSHQYLFLHLFLFFSFTSLYFIFDTHFKGSQFDQKQIQILSQQLKYRQFQEELAQLDFENHLNTNTSKQSSVKQRQLASIPKFEINPSMKNQSLSQSQSQIQHSSDSPDFLAQFYFMRSRQLKSQGQKKEAYLMLKKIKDISADENILSQADYEFIQLECAKNDIKIVCLDVVDKMVMRYPYSDWTGQALYWLNQSYLKKSKYEDAEVVKNILIKNFKLDSTQKKAMNPSSRQKAISEGREIL